MSDLRCQFSEGPTLKILSLIDGSENKSASFRYLNPIIVCNSLYTNWNIQNRTNLFDHRHPMLQHKAEVLDIARWIVEDIIKYIRTAADRY